MDKSTEQKQVAPADSTKIETPPEASSHFGLSPIMMIIIIIIVIIIGFLIYKKMQKPEPKGAEEKVGQGEHMESSPVVEED
jgi:flagellar biosynthesis/type III secretory pathway M-ring protein FliF/YscJ